MRIGIDVGGTNTDAVLMDGVEVVAWHKTPTTPDITSGITAALKAILTESKAPPAAIQTVMIGTTHFVNAVIERRWLTPVAAIRLCLPSGKALPPMVDWPDDLRDALGHHVFLAHGGHEFDGREIASLDEAELRGIAAEVRRRQIGSVAISAVFSPVNPQFEERAASILRETIPHLSITLSHDIGRMGLLERENTAILNAALRELAGRIAASFEQALGELRIDAPFYLSQNDGTLMNADYAAKYPVFTFASGPTNSMRGAAFLSGVKEAMVVDVGGTCTDVGMLAQGFPRETSVAGEIGGVRTNFRMPDVLSLGMGGSSLVRRENGGVHIGPHSVGYELETKALVFGGDTLTATDVAVAHGLARIGNPAAVQSLDRRLVCESLSLIQERVETAVDRMKTSDEPMPVITVGGGSILISRPVRGSVEMIKPPHFAVANAVGAAIALIGGEVDRVYALEKISREMALAESREEAVRKAVAAGADPMSVQIRDIEEVPLTYLPGNAVRLRVKAVGELAA
ncbi:MAG: hydantoinase/oxoprolinase family protein [Chloroflexi bacterium]|nr:hydantoinase/oxoprolinase family protein [Chloroflexota bacterium]